MTTLWCATDRRREAVRQHVELNGFDYVEVGADNRVLTVHFLGKAPVALEPANIVIDGGRRIRGIRAEQVTIRRTSYPGLDDTMEVVVDREGDFSTYRLRVVQRDEQGTEHRHPAFDPHYDAIDFTFKADCTTGLDCRQETPCPPALVVEPEISYLAKDYASFRRLMLDRLALIMPDWRERHVPDLGIAVVEVFAYVADHLSYYQDAVATEAYLHTARQRISVRRHARLVDHALHEGCNARTWVCVGTDAVVTLDPRDVAFVTRIDGLDRVARATTLDPFPPDTYEVFEPMAAGEIALYPGQHEMRFHKWGDERCCLLRGATTATLIGRWIEPPPAPGEPPCEPAKGEVAAAGQRESSGEGEGPDLHLRVGDVLILEEVIGPGTGAAADADRTHRHPVRLTRIAHVRDPLVPARPLTEITWADEDALPFPLCLSVMGPPPACAPIGDVSVARGNLVLVDHGRRVVEDLDPVPAAPATQSCDCDGVVADVPGVAGRFRPVLRAVPVTVVETPAPGVAASRMLEQDPRRALPQVALTTGHVAGQAATSWSAQRDLLGSRNPDRHFVVEMDGEGRAHLRFGDDELGQRPDPGTAFRAAYRIGNGPAGNVGADAIAHLVTREHSLSGGVTSVRNPLAARGGTAAEPLAEARLFAPHAFRQRLERAVTAEDYAAIVEREFPSVQRAAATLRWNGSWHEVLVAIDPLGQEEADPALLAAIEARLHRYRRIGHDVRVMPARRVSLDIALAVCVAPGYLRAHVKAAVSDALGTRRLPDGTTGVFHADRLTFGDGIYLSVLVAAAQAVAGVESVAVTRLQRLYEAADGEIDAGVLPLGPLEIARLDNDPGMPEHGRLRIDVRGGR